MQRTDPGFLYGLGASIRPLWKITADTDALEAYQVLSTAKDAVFWSQQSIYNPSLRQARSLGEGLHSKIDAMMKRAEAEDWDGVFYPAEFQALHTALVDFEGAYITELRNAQIYYVEPHSGLDIEQLITQGEILFPVSLESKVPAAKVDVREGAKALAFRLWTASGYHFHRANEAVLRAYFDHVAPSIQRDSKWSMGILVKKLSDNKLGHKPILAALENIIQFHRNPLIHLEDTIDDSEEAISLYSAIRSAMGYMLDELPSPPPAIVTTPVVQP